MNRGKRRDNTDKRVKKREKLIDAFGLHGGAIYERHCKKIEKSRGYIRDGNVTHFVKCGFNEKTRDRNRYGKVLMLSHRDKQKIDECNQQVAEMIQDKKRKE